MLLGNGDLGTTVTRPAVIGEHAHCPLMISPQKTDILHELDLDIHEQLLLLLLLGAGRIAEIAARRAQIGEITPRTAGIGKVTVSELWELDSERSLL